MNTQPTEEWGYACVIRVLAAAAGDGHRFKDRSSSLLIWMKKHGYMDCGYVPGRGTVWTLTDNGKEYLQTEREKILQTLTIGKVTRCLVLVDKDVPREKQTMCVGSEDELGDICDFYHGQTYPMFSEGEMVHIRREITCAVEIEGPRGLEIETDLHGMFPDWYPAGTEMALMICKRCHAKVRWEFKMCHPHMSGCTCLCPECEDRCYQYA